MSAEPEARPSRPSVTLTAFVVAQMIMPAQIDPDRGGHLEADVAPGDVDRLGDARRDDEPPGHQDADDHRDVVLLLPEDATVVALADLDEVVEEPHQRHEQHADPDDHRLVRERKTSAEVGDDPADEGGDDDRDAAHRRRALLVHVVFGPVILLAEDRLALSSVRKNTISHRVPNSDTSMALAPASMMAITPNASRISVATRTSSKSTTRSAYSWVRS